MDTKSASRFHVALKLCGMTNPFFLMLCTYWVYTIQSCTKRTRRSKTHRCNGRSHPFEASLQSRTDRTSSPRLSTHLLPSLQPCRGTSALGYRLARSKPSSSSSPSPTSSMTLMSVSSRSCGRSYPLVAVVVFLLRMQTDLNPIDGFCCFRGPGLLNSSGGRRRIRAPIPFCVVFLGVEKFGRRL